VTAYKAITTINPDAGFAYEKIGYFEMQAGNTQAAQNAFDKAIALNPMAATTYSNRGFLYHMQKNV